MNKINEIMSIMNVTATRLQAAYPGVHIIWTMPKAKGRGSERLKELQRRAAKEFVFYKDTPIPSAKQRPHRQLEGILRMAGNITGTHWTSLRQIEKNQGCSEKKYRPKYPPKEWGMRYILNMTPPEQTKARNVIIIGDESWVDETNPYASEWKKQVPWTVWPISVRKGSIKKHARKIARQQFMNILKPGDMVFITLGRRDLWAKRKRERRQKTFAAS